MKMPLTQQQITIVFQSILRRDPRPQEIRIWTAGDRMVTALADNLIPQATEPRSIARLYLSLFGMYPDGLEAPYTGRDGLTFWIGKLRGLRADHPGIDYKTALRHTIIDWFDAELHRIIYGTENTCAVFTDVLCKQALNRTPNEAERQEWGNIKDWGTATKAKLAIEVTESQECKLRFNSLINDRLRELAVASCSSAEHG